MTAIQLPAELNALLQTNQLQKEFQLGLRAKLEYRGIAERMRFPVTIGQTLTATRSGYLPAVTDPLNPSTNTNLDNGLTPVVAPIEQYTISVNMYGLTQNLNTVANAFGIADQFQRNSFNNGENAARSLDAIARNSVFDAYMGGNTYVTTTATSTTIAVDDIRGFSQVLVNGQFISPSGSNPLSVNVNGTDFDLTGSAADTINTSKTFRGISGTLTFSSSVTATQGDYVIGNFAPKIFRPSDRTTSVDLVDGDWLSMAILQEAVAYQRDNAIPDFGGFYNCYLDNQTLNQLFRDSDFRQLYTAGFQSPEYRGSRIVETLGLRFITTTQAPVQAQVTAAGALVSGVSVRRSIICGPDTLVEGVFEGQEGIPIQNSNIAYKQEIDGAVMVVRGAIDRLAQIISQSWYSVIGYVAPSDATANSSIIGTASNAYLKRATILETVLSPPAT
jgi:hypothetical protein